MGDKIKEQGNEAFKAGDVNTALGFYDKALKALSERLVLL